MLSSLVQQVTAVRLRTKLTVCELAVQDQASRPAPATSINTCQQRACFPCLHTVELLMLADPMQF